MYTFQTIAPFLALALGLVLIILGGIISGSANNASSGVSKTNIKNCASGIIVIGLIFFLLGGYQLYELYGKNLMRGGKYYYY
jgi:uncharacterized membrane protein